MRFILPALGTKDDVLPFLGLAAELNRRGHTSLILSAEPYRSLCEKQGLDFEAVLSNEEHNELLNHPNLWKPYLGLNVYVRLCGVRSARRVFSEIERRAAKEECAIVCNHLVPGGFVAAEKLGLPIASVALRPYAYESARSPARETPLGSAVLRMAGESGRTFIYRMVHRYLNSLLQPVNDFRLELGLAPWPDYFAQTRYQADLLIGLWPDWFCPPKQDWPGSSVRAGFVDRKSEDADWIHRMGLERFLQGGLIVFATDPDLNQKLSRQIDLFSETCDRLNMKGLLVSSTLRGRGVVVLSERFRVIESAPLDQIFKMASAVVSHGGIGTLAEILAAGKPSVVLPMAFDQFDSAHHMQRLGVGISLPWFVTAKRMASAVTQLLTDPKYRILCRHYRQQRRSELGLAMAVDYIETALIRGQQHQLIGSPA